MTVAELIPVIVSILLALGLGSSFNALVNRRKMGADATSVVTAAARELVDPLRKELAAERADHSGELEVERQKVKQVRAELESAMNEARRLREELASLRREMNAERAAHREQMEMERTAHSLEVGRYLARIRELEGTLPP